MADRSNGAQSPEEQVRALYEDAESGAAKAFEADGGTSRASAACWR